MLYPFIFHPIFKERVWGGRKLESLYSKHLPPRVPIGESWEISDRPGDASVIANGPLAGKDLHWLMQNHSVELRGTPRNEGGRFPLLVKILDAREKLSLQVHPPADKAAALGGEPKTEMWYIADAAPGSELYVGVKRGVTRQEFEQKIGAGTVAECFHRIRVKKGDAMFLPSGRVHALGAGLVIFEIQQNSDTTYRVFDWNRVGLDGKPRELHVRQSLESIAFDDVEPGLVAAAPTELTSMTHRTLVKNSLFSVRVHTVNKNGSLSPAEPGLRIIGLVEGRATVTDGTAKLELKPGGFCLIPAAGTTAEAWFEAGSTFLMVQTGA